MSTRFTIDGNWPKPGVETNIAVAAAAGINWSGEPSPDGTLWAHLPSVGGVCDFNPSVNFNEALEALCEASQNDRGPFPGSGWEIEYSSAPDGANMVSITICDKQTEWDFEMCMERPQLAVCGAIIAWARDIGRLPRPDAEASTGEGR